MKLIKPTLKYLSFVIYFCLLFGVGLKLFFPEQFGRIFETYFSADQVNQSESLTILYASAATSFEPTKYDAVNRAWMGDVYEGLVSVDENLSVQPALAVSWGNLSDTLWEFKLRPDVRFHDGRTFHAGDVKYSLEKALGNQESELKNLLASVESVDVIDELTLRIETNVLDLLLLNKLAAIYIVPDEVNDLDKKPIGTGIYRVVDFQPGRLAELEYFSLYWDQFRSVAFKNVTLSAIADKDERMDRVISGKVDFLNEVPPGSIDALKNLGMTVVNRPSLEVDFLVFNMDSRDGENIFANESIREAVSLMIDQDRVVDFIKDFGFPATQFVSRGVYGFDADISAREYDFERAKELVRQTSSFTRLSGRLDLMKGLEVLGEYIADELFKLGVDLQVQYLALEELQVRVGAGKSDFYFLGWRSELADVSDFYKFVVHTKTADGKYGTYNGGNFSNAEIDTLIELSEQTFDATERLAILRKIMRKLVQEDYFGLPLFEPELIFAYRKGLSWKPRYDGYVLPSSIK